MIWRWTGYGWAVSLPTQAAIPVSNAVALGVCRAWFAPEVTQ